MLAIFTSIPLAFVLTTPFARPAIRFGSTPYLLDAKFGPSPSVLAALPQRSELEHVPTGEGSWLLQIRRLLLRRVAWARGCSSAEDVLLALVAPYTFKLVAQWRRDAFGGELCIQKSLAAAREQIVSANPARVHSVSVRSKSLWSTFHKAAVRRQCVHDVLAVRVIVSGEQDACFRGMDAVRCLWPTLPGRTKDYVNRPKPNGYQSLHDTVLLPCGTLMEVQVRTEEMHRHAEHGLASHRRYKGRAHELPAKLLEDISSLGLLPLPGGRFSHPILQAFA